jgi:hypothetical protein
MSGLLTSHKHTIIRALDAMLFADTVEAHN